MKINSISKIPVHTVQPSMHHSIFYSRNNTNIDRLTFNGKYYDGVYYSDDEIERANRYLRTIKDDPSYDWQDDYLNDETNRLENNSVILNSALDADADSVPGALLLTFHIFTLGTILLTTHAKYKNDARNSVAPKIERMKKLMPALTAEKREEQFMQQKKLEIQAKYEKNKNKIITVLSKEFFDKLAAELSGKQISVPTCIMIKDDDEHQNDTMLNSDDVIKILKDKSGCKIADTISYYWGGKEEQNALLYRIETSLEEAQKHYKATGQRTILEIQNFAALLSNNKFTSDTFSRLKNLLSEMGTEHLPLTIVFSTDDDSAIDSTFKVNNTRIQSKIDLTKLQQE